MGATGEPTTFTCEQYVPSALDPQTLRCDFLPQVQFCVTEKEPRN